MGRLSVACVRAGDHATALRLVDESVALKRLPAAARREAVSRCDEATRVMRVGQIYDEEAARSLALRRIETLRSGSPTAAEMAAFDNVVEAAQAEGGPGHQARASRRRAHALAVRGKYRAEHADLSQCIDLLRAVKATERMNASAAMRVGSPTDRALARRAALDQQNQLVKEKLFWVVLAATALLFTGDGLGHAPVLNRRRQWRLTLVSERDDLTGLRNRRKIIEDAEQQFALAR